MTRFYNVPITKRAIGSAIEHHEPAVQGTVVIKVPDIATGGDFILFVIEADKAQHQANLDLPGVEALDEAEALERAARYQPERTTERFDPLTRQTKEVTTPAVDLTRFYKTEGKSDQG